MCGWVFMLQIECNHGHYKFTELRSGEVSRFQTLFGLEIVRHPDGYFTFPLFLDAPTFSIEGVEYLGAIATETFEGTPGEILKANSLVYNFATKLVVPIEQITTEMQINQANFYFLSSGLILPGSLVKSGRRIVEYSGFYLREIARFKYSVVSYV